MAKLKLVAAPTFKAKVGIPVAGGIPVEVEMTFKHRTKVELEAFFKARAGKSDADSFLDMVSAWELDEELNQTNVHVFLENYHGAGIETLRKYIDELVQAKVKN